MVARPDVRGMGVDAFTVRLEAARSDSRALLDLTETDPARCGLAWDRAELDAILADTRARAGEDWSTAERSARDAVASYVAGAGVTIAPERIRFTTSRALAHASALQLTCGAGDDIVISSPSTRLVEGVPAAGSLHVSRCALQFDGAWRLERRSLEHAMTRRTRAVVLGNPSEPTGAVLTRDDLAFIEERCARHASVIVVDESFADTTLARRTTVLEAERCLGVQVSGLSGVCGLPGLGAEWYAVAGPEELAGPALSQVGSLRTERSPCTSVLLAVPALLARRGAFLSSLRKRLAENRATLAARAVGESPWSLLWGGGGWSGVLEIGSAEEDQAVCLSLLGDGVAVQPGSWFGLPSRGYLVVSLLPPVEVFAEALSRLDRRLRAPLVG